MTDQSKPEKPKIDKNKFYTFRDRCPPVAMEDFVNTSGMKLPNEKVLVKEGVTVKSGYLSNSAIGDYRKCQRYFKFKQIDRIPTKSSAAMATGSAIHYGAEITLTPKVGNPGAALPPWEEVRDLLRTDIRKRYDNENLDDEDKATLGRELDLCVRLMHEFYLRTAPKLNPVSLEEMFITEIPILGTSGSIKCMGFIDLVDQMTPTRQSVIDFKTGKMLKTVNDIITDQQMILYSMAKKIPDVAFITMTKGSLGKAGGVSEKTGKPLKGRAGTAPKIVRIDGVKTISDYQKLTEDISSITKSINAGYFDRSGRGTWLCSEKACAYFHKCLG